MPNEWYLVVGEGLGGREGEQARRLAVWELGGCRVLGERLREPRMSELGAGGWCRWRCPMSGTWRFGRVCEGGRGSRLRGCLRRSLGGVGCWARGLESREWVSWGLEGGVGGGAQ